MRFLTVLLVVVVATVGNVNVASAAIIGDARHKDRRPSPEDAPHMAYLITASRINYQDLRAATETLDGIKNGHVSFIEAMRRQAEFNKRNSRNKEPNYSGDLGLLSYDQLDGQTARVLFDVRIPVSTTADKIIGPICDEDYGCSIYIVFSRFRRSFFSQAWLDADEFCLNNDLDFGQFLQGVNSDDNRIFAARIWPDDIPSFQRLKLKQVQNDLKRMKDGDPSTEPPKARRVTVAQAHLDSAKEKMADRRRFFDAFFTKELVKLRPEVQTMTIGEIIRSGWVDMAKVKRMGFDKFANEGVRPSKATGGAVGEEEENGTEEQPRAQQKDERQTPSKKETPGTRMMYGTGGVVRDLGLEGVANPSPVDGSVQTPEERSRLQRGQHEEAKECSITRNGAEPHATCGGSPQAPPSIEKPIEVEQKKDTTRDGAAEVVAEQRRQEADRQATIKKDAAERAAKNKKRAEEAAEAAKARREADETEDLSEF